MTVNDQLLQAIKARKSPLESFGCGITTADHYVRTLQECAGSDLCYRYAATRQESFNDILRKASSTLVYRNPEMVVSTERAASEVLVKSVPEMPSLGVEFKTSTEQGLELPKDTLVVFRHILTTPRKDRDGDVLRTEGAEMDPKMLLLWQHVHNLPIGKVLGAVRHDEKSLEVVSAIVDMNDLCHDAAVMVENDMARFSHGFRAKEWDSLKDDDGNETGGFDITKFEIMEGSVVSIPSNRDAETQEVLLSLVEGGKLTSPMMKEVGRTIREATPKQFTGIDVEEKQDDLSEEEVSPKEEDVVQPEGPKREGKCGCGGEKESAPAEEGQASETEEVSGDKEVALTGVKEYHSIGYLTGSWESKRCGLDKQLRTFFENSEVDVSERFCYLVGTFEDHVIVCSESYSYGEENEYLHYKVTWSMEESGPKLQGSPEPVTVVVEAKDAEHLRETKSERLGQNNTERAAAEFLSAASQSQRRAISTALAAIEEAEQRRKYAEQFKSLTRG